MRFVLATFPLLLLCMAPCVAQEKARAGDAHAGHIQAGDIVDLQGVQSAAPAASRRSAFGRVMDVMIAKLIEQEKTRPARARDRRGQQHPGELALEAAPPHARKAGSKAPQIDIAIGERFALPPAASLGHASVPE